MVAHASCLRNKSRLGISKSSAPTSRLPGLWFLTTTSPTILKSCSAGRCSIIIMQEDGDNEKNGALGGQQRKRRAGDGEEGEGGAFFEVGYDPVPCGLCPAMSSSATKGEVAQPRRGRQPDRGVVDR